LDIYQSIYIFVVFFENMGMNGIDWHSWLFGAYRGWVNLVKLIQND